MKKWFRMLQQWCYRLNLRAHAWFCVLPFTLRLMTIWPHQAVFFHFHASPAGSCTRTYAFPALVVHLNARFSQPHGSQCQLTPVLSLFPPIPVSSCFFLIEPHRFSLYSCDNSYRDLCVTSSDQRNTCFFFSALTAAYRTLFKAFAFSCGLLLTATRFLSFALGFTLSYQFAQSWQDLSVVCDFLVLLFIIAIPFIFSRRCWELFVPLPFPRFCWSPMLLFLGLCSAFFFSLNIDCYSVWLLWLTSSTFP